MVEQAIESGIPRNTNKPTGILGCIRADVLQGLLMWPLWTALAWEDLKQRYTRTLFGVAWVLLSFGLFVGVKVVIFGQLSEAEEVSFTIFLCAGFLIWQFINGVIGDGSSVFVSSSSWMQGIKLPLSLFVYQRITRNVVTFLLSAIILVVIMIYEKHSLEVGALMAIPAMLIILINAVWVGLLLGTICARFRDLQHLIQTVMRIMFFLTPILWLPSSLGKLGKYVWWNPFTHYLEIFRAPLLTGDVALFSWSIVLGVTAVGWGVTILVFGYYRKQIIFWI